MPQVDQIQIGTTTYDILQSDNAIFTGTTNDNEDGSSTSWITVAKLASSETNASIFTKLSSMFKNVRYLYSKIGDLDIGDIGTSIGDAIKNLSEGKADKNHTHDTTDLKASDGTNLIVTTQTADNNHVPSALLVKNMNDTLTALSNSASSYVTSLSVSGNIIYYKHDNTNLGNITVTNSDTTYAVTTTAKAGLAPRLGGGTTNYLRADGNWAAPPDTKYTLPAATGNALGGIKASLSGTTLTLST